MTYIPIRDDALAPLEARLDELAPWMHCFKLGESTFVGYYKVQGLGLDETYCGRASPADRRSRLSNAYAAYNAIGPRAWFMKLWDCLGLSDRRSASLLDLSSATGEKSFWAAQAGFGSIVSSEIRLNQHRQHQALLDATSETAYKAIRAVHDPISADDVEFPKSYGNFDVVCSFGLLYHLQNPYQHLRNLHQLTRRFAILETITHQEPNAKGYWSFLLEDARVITKAVSSISWKPHYLAVVEMAKLAGFRSVEIHYPDCFAVNFPDFRAGAFPH